MTNLKKIYLYSNQVKAIHPNLFIGLAKLEIIDFRGNKIEKIHKNAFKSFQKSKTIVTTTCMINRDVYFCNFESNHDYDYDYSRTGKNGCLYALLRVFFENALKRT